MRKPVVEHVSAPIPTEPREAGVQLQWGLKIPMRDGVELNATFYLPSGSEAVPAIFTMTPYIADSYHARGSYFARSGYAFGIVDCRGRGNSGGDFFPFLNDGRDAFDVVEWLAGQPWCVGSVGMWGGSYGGFNQWMALKQSPPHLKTIAPAASAHAGVDFPFFKNVFFSYEMQWLTLVSGRSGNGSLFGDQAFWIECFRRLYLSRQPFKKLDEIVGNPSPIFQTWLEHPTVDEFWKQMWLTPEEYNRINVPILTITGSYDDDQPGALHYYCEHMRHGSPEARSRHYLLVGPWDHAGTRTPEREFGGLTFSEKSLLDLNRLHKEWYDWTLKDGERPKFLKDRVTYYLMGADEWKYAPAVDQIGSEPQLFYIASKDGCANDVFHSGALQDQPQDSAQPDSYTYDPCDLRPAELEQKWIDNYLTDESYELNLFGNGLVYHSPPFDAAVELTGWPRASIWMMLDIADTDFIVTLAEILPDGRHIRLCQDLLRARYRQSFEVEKLVPENRFLCYEFSGFPFISRRIAKGSRLRLVVASPNSIFFEKNYNNGGVVAEAGGAQACTAHISLAHDADHPSYIELPLLRK